MKTAVIQFPGSNCDLDILHVLKNVLHVEAELVWHRDFKDSEFGAAILPGGFSYGDYLRAGIIAAHSPAIEHIKEMVSEGKLVIGICNGFQILVESELLPGALLMNQSTCFICKWVKVRVETDETPFTRHIKRRTVLNMPIAHAEGRYVNDPEGLKELHENDQVIFRYVNPRGEVSEDSNPNGSMDSIAGICNPERNVLGLMPHPERASEPVLSPFSDSDGLKLLSILKS
ncbi:phosphoribosylformylglycinamidine synthase I [Candidatus Bathyarchaeota archaeon]|nr:phosphoribosylformylglycinamidine synthase I [Candidatus Bathyarchaeota archaeon]MBS7629090.1 phosphoribosylformylglycinamidine synthase I [Candidatus Bathyarchaeota archaeon]